MTRILICPLALIASILTLAAAGFSSPLDPPGSAHERPAAITSTNDPVERAYEQVLKEDDAAQEEVDKWIKDNREFAAKGGGMSDSELNRRIETRFESVTKGYENFLKQHPNHARAHVAYGSFLGDKGDEEGARSEYEKALKLDTNNPAIYNNLANIYGHSGPVEKAFEFYAKAVALEPREPVYYHNWGTVVYLFRKDAAEYYKMDENQVFAKAFSLYSNAMRLDPDNFPLASDVAQTYYGIRPLRTEEALKAWTNALAIAHDEIEREGVYAHFARIKLLAGRYDEAKRHLAAITNEMYAELKGRLTKNLNERQASAKTNAPASTNGPALAPVTTGASVSSERN